MRKSLKSAVLAAALIVVSAPVWAYENESPTEKWYHLWDETFWDIVVIGVSFALFILYTLVRFRRKSPDQVGKPTRLSTVQMLGWALIPAFVFLADDFYLAANCFDTWLTYRTVPKGAYEIKIEAEMWNWNFTYPNGVQVDKDDGLRVPVGTPVAFRMTSTDVIHSFFLPDFRVKEDVMPGRTTYYWFYPKEVGEHVFTCAEYCGENHSNMFGKLTVMPKEAFNQWLKEAAKS